MQCCFCTGRYDAQTERDLGSTLQQLQLDIGTVWQYKPPFWAGRVDFFMAPHQVNIQVDGKAHFDGTFRRLRLPDLARKDLMFNTAAWAAGAKVLRVHYKDLGGPEVVEALQLAVTFSSRVAGPFLLLSPAFGQVRWCEQQGWLPVSYIAWMCNAASGCRVERSAMGCTCLLAPTR